MQCESLNSSSNYLLTHHTVLSSWASLCVKLVNMPMYGYGWNLKVYHFTSLVQYDVVDLSGEHCY